MEEVAASGKKAIVFSQWVKTTGQDRSERLARFGPLQYHGKIPSQQRDADPEAVQGGPDRHVILMSYGAGSVGLNLQFCEYVFLFDRWWNPAIEDQAINRAHRIGATGPVTVTRMLAARHDRRTDQPGAGAEARTVRRDPRQTGVACQRGLPRTKSSACSICARPKGRSKPRPKRVKISGPNRLRNLDSRAGRHYNVQKYRFVGRLGSRRGLEANGSRSPKVFCPGARRVRG